MRHWPPSLLAGIHGLLATRDTPDPSDPSDHRGKKRNVPFGKSRQAIFLHNFLGPKSPSHPRAYRALIRPSGEDAMGRSCSLDSPPPPGRGMPAAVQMPAVVRMPACHSRRFKGERPIGAATG